MFPAPEENPRLEHHAHTALRGQARRAPEAFGKIRGDRPPLLNRRCASPDRCAVARCSRAWASLLRRPSLFAWLGITQARSPARNDRRAKPRRFIQHWSPRPCALASPLREHRAPDPATSPRPSAGASPRSASEYGELVAKDSSRASTPPTSRSTPKHRGPRSSAPPPSCWPANRPGPEVAAMPKGFAM